MTTLEEYELVCEQLTAVQAAITANLLSKNKKYKYENIESKHEAELQSLNDLTNREKFLLERKSTLKAQLTKNTFVKITNY